MLRSACICGFLAAVAVAHAAAQNADQPQSNPDLRFEWTQFAGAAVSGEGDDDLKYGGKVDIHVSLDASRFLWEGLTIKAHPEFVYGRNINGSGAGVLLPPNLALSFPSNNEDDFDLSLYLVQSWGKTSLTFGKVNMLDFVAATPLIGGGGLEGFQHTALAAPPSGITPPTIFGALVSTPLESATLTVGVWDAASAINRTGLENPFETGVAGMVSLTIPAPIQGQAGIHTVSLQATDRRGLDLADIPDVLLPPESEAVLGEEQGGVQFKYAVQQYLWTDPNDPRRGWGVFAQAAVWQDNPLPFKWNVALGVTGSPPFASRPEDRFGLGYYRIGLSPALEQGLAHFLAIGDEQGLEAFYTFQIGRHFRLTANAQYIDPFVTGFDDALFLGVRLRATL